MYTYCMLLIFSFVSKKLGSLSLFKCFSLLNFSPPDIPYILENLEPQKAYVFRFAAKNQVGYGEWALEESHTMPKRAAPEEPYIIGRAEKGFVSTPYPDRYELLWSAPPNNGEPIDYFQVIYVAVRNLISLTHIHTHTQSTANYGISLSYRVTCLFSMVIMSSPFGYQRDT